jgi:hypothetical protein
MRERIETGGLSVLDGGAIVTGAAVASIHLRGVMPGELAAPGWLLIWGVFLGVALTSAGPFLFLVRRFLRRLPNYPKVGDTLWAVLGLPWLATAMIRSATPATSPGRDSLLVISLSLGLAVVSVIVLTVIWSRWVMVSPEEAARITTAPWTNRVGLVVAVAWPIQCGMGLVVLDGR